ncbi:hypothetical protein CHARACLAT_009254 [Characodon lateralis]|uniref:Uncharacterized protein n=1 Tax=Characodon lateralis TaxID=208331 RepID=A0ABU7F247_9TELE|nr:hypothetical protein [Characodon lateralis]
MNFLDVPLAAPLVHGVRTIHHDSPACPPSSAPPPLTTTGLFIFFIIFQPHPTLYTYSVCLLLSAILNFSCEPGRNIDLLSCSNKLFKLLFSVRNCCLHENYTPPSPNRHSPRLSRLHASYRQFLYSGTPSSLPLSCSLRSSTNVWVFSPVACV